MKKNINRIIILLSISAVLAGFGYLVLAGFDFTDHMVRGRKIGLFLILFLLITVWNGLLFLIYMVTEQRTLEIKRNVPGDL